MRTDVDYLANRAAYDALAEKVVYTGTIDSYFDYKCGELEYEACALRPKFWIHRIIRALRSSTIRTVKRRIRASSSTSILRSVSRKKRSSRANILRFGSRGWKAYYPVNNEKNSALYQQYKALADAEPNVIFGGRLAEYKYYDMDKVIEAALSAVEKNLRSKTL